MDVPWKGKAIKKMSGRQKAHSTGIGLFGEELFVEKMKQIGLKFNDTREYQRFDFEVYGKRIEVKTSRLGKGERWCFDFSYNKNQYDILVCCGELDGKWHWIFFSRKDLEGLTALGLRPRLNSKKFQKYTQHIDDWNYFNFLLVDNSINKAI